jgi:hypothetical protein
VEVEYLVKVMPEVLKMVAVAVLEPLALLDLAVG